MTISAHINRKRKCVGGVETQTIFYSAYSLCFWLRIISTNPNQLQPLSQDIINHRQVREKQGDNTTNIPPKNFLISSHLPKNLPAQNSK